ncbi:hypothetical protein AB0M11_39630 [Streptomyces sp. NPDC051987]|uniref:hypothetical protein n=1 Tax=Streptomyces sp. NPDC051987 TaxID=3155808 RepID=UPI00343B4A19
MFSITFVPDSVRRPTERQLDALPAASEMDLRYEYFETDVSLTTDEFGTEEFPVTTAIDFVDALLVAARNVRQGIVGTIGFTENDLVIEFRPEGETVTVVRSWDAPPGTCGIEEFVTAVSDFCNEILQYIVLRYPAFRENSMYSKLAEMLSGMVQG